MYIIEFKTTERVGENSSRGKTYRKIVDENTTIKEIKEWYSATDPEFFTKMKDITLSEPDQQAHKPNPHQEQNNIAESVKIDVLPDPMEDF